MVGMPLSLRHHARYLVALVAVVCGLYFSIVNGDSGLLFPSTQSLFADPEVPTGQYDLQALEVLNRALLRVKDNYVEPDRIDPSAMMAQALNAVQEEIPQVVARFDRPLDQHPTRVDMQVNQEHREFQIDNLGSLWEMSFRLKDVFRFIQDNLTDTDIDLRLVEYAAINGLLQTLDPHSVLLTPEVYQDMMANNRGSFGGLGIVISIRDGQLTVVSPIDGTPADRAGLRSGDHIVKIGEESTINMSIEEAVSRLRGDPGTSVSIEVMRDGWTVPHEFTIVREIINIQSVNSQDLGDGIAYVQITNFQGNTYEDLRRHLDDRRAATGGIRGLVLDLRDNPGGLLEQAILVADTFVSSGTIVTTVGEGQRLREEKKATEEGTEPLYPIVVLVSPGSASASEIVAGALQNLGRALIVGDRTFGKGSVQVLYEFHDGSALKLTIAQYLTPGDVSIQSVGIVPDITAIPMSVAEDHVDLFAPRGIIRESDLPSHLYSVQPRELTDSSATIRYYREPEPEPDPDALRDPDEFEMDFEIELARRVLLASGGVWEAAGLWEATSTVRDDVSEEQMDLVTERLSARGVDWSQGADMEAPALDLAFSSNWPENQVPSGEAIELTLTATNNSDATLYRAWALSACDNGMFNDLEFPFGRLDPGQSRSWTVPVSVPVEEDSRLDVLSFSLFLDERDLDQVESEQMTVLGRERPHFAFSYQVLDDEGGNGDGLLQVGESVRFLFTVTNLGPGASSEILVYLKNKVESAILLEAGRETWETGLTGGESRTAQFGFQVRRAPVDGVVRFEAAIYDTVFREFASHDIEFTLAPDGEIMTPDEGWVEVSRDGTFVYASASDTSPVLAVANHGDALPRMGHLGDWIRVSWAPERIGWMRENDATATSAAETAAVLGMRQVYQPPMIRLDSHGLWTDSSTLRLTGQLEDDGVVADYFIWVASDSEDNLEQRSKVNYTLVGQAHSEFSQDVPLYPGINLISVFARDDDRMTQSAVQYVYRRTSGEVISGMP